jgi:hypothetical protein
LDPPEVVWATFTASSKHYDSRVVLDRLNAIASVFGGTAQSATFPTRPNPYSASEWWLDDLVWRTNSLTLCAFSDPDGTDLLISAWGDAAEAAIGDLERFLEEQE